MIREVLETRTAFDTEVIGSNVPFPNDRWSTKKLGIIPGASCPSPQRRATVRNYLGVGPCRMVNR